MRSGIVLGSVAGLVLAGAPGVAAADPPTDSLAHRAASATEADSVEARLATLVTGDRVRIITPVDGRTRVVVRAAVDRGVRGAFQKLRIDGRSYVIPAAAVPYLGRTLDPALFDVARLARRGRAGVPGRLPLHIAFRPDATSHEVPGVTVARRSGNSIEGYVTPGSARRLGAALAEQWRADRTNGGDGGGLFARVRSISLAGRTFADWARFGAGGEVHPNYPMHTLTLKGLDAAGDPAENGGTVYLVNVDDARKLVDAQGFGKGGIAAFSVPAGHFGVLALFSRPVSAGVFEVRFVVLGSITVRDDKTVTIDASDATSALSVDTPRPAKVHGMQVIYHRADGQGRGYSVGYLLGADARVLVSPTRRVETGKLHFYSYWRLVGGGGHYIYDLEFPEAGSISGDQSHRVDPGRLARIQAAYAADLAGGEGSELRFSFLPWETFGIRTTLPMRVPTRRTEYVSGNPAIAWGQQASAHLEDVEIDDGFVVVLPFGTQVDSLRSYSAGERTRSRWFADPLHPGAELDLGPKIGDYFLAPASRGGDTLFLNLYPYGDNEPGHVGLPNITELPGAELPPVVDERSFTLYRNGEEIASSTDPAGAFEVTPQPATYRMVYETRREAPWIALSTRARTAWTFRSLHQQGAELPRDWYCGETGSRRDCSLLPLLTVEYEPSPLDLRGRSRPGPTRLTLSVSHLQHSSTSPIAGAKVEVSFDGGETWQAAGVREVRDGVFEASYDNPSTGYVAIRASAWDEAGSRISQTIYNAYTLPSTSGAP